MNYSTDTRFVIPDADTRARIDRQHNAAATSYLGRHSTEVRAPFTPQRGRHQVDDSQTMLITPAQVQAVKAVASVPPRQTLSRVVEVHTPEPLAPVTGGLLRRVLRGLRRVK